MLSTLESTASQASYTLWQMVLYMLRLGSLGFGGPVALVDDSSIPRWPANSRPPAM